MLFRLIVGFSESEFPFGLLLMVMGSVVSTDLLINSADCGARFCLVPQLNSAVYIGPVLVARLLELSLPEEHRPQNISRLAVLFGGATCLLQ